MAYSSSGGQVERMGMAREGAWVCGQAGRMGVAR